MEEKFNAPAVDKFEKKSGSIKEQIENLNRPPTPEEKLACCLEDLALKSSTEQRASQFSQDQSATSELF